MENIVKDHNYSVSAIVCAFNEEELLPGVVRTLIDAEDVSEVIVINDGSTDGTSAALKALAKNPKAQIIEFPHNRGKGFALAAGISEAQSDILLFVDADLINFKKCHIRLMLSSLCDGKADMVIGQPTKNDLAKKINPFKSLGGERAVFKKDILQATEKIKNSGYGAETIFNLFYIAQNKRVKYVHLRGILHPIKLDKYSTNTAIRNYWREAYQIAKSITVNYTLLLLVIRNTIGKII